MSDTGSKPIVAKDQRNLEVRYQTQGEPLGAGSGGVVYLAVRMPDSQDSGADDARRVAIKVTHVPEWKTRLADEARLLHTLQENAETIVKRSGSTVYRPIRIGSGPTPLKVDDSYGSELIELEYLDGPTLKQWFEDTWIHASIPEPLAIVDEVLRTARQLAEALVQIQAGDTALIHRDVKPENIMRTSRGLRLFDFNVAREDSRWTKTQHVGTHGYIAPEIVEGRDYDARSDLFGVGVILWEIAHRRRFDLPLHTLRIDGRLRLKWPSSTVTAWPDYERAVLDEILPLLVCELTDRLQSAEILLSLVDRLEAPRRASRRAGDPLANLDMIRLLWELRPSGLVSVVTDTTGRVPHQELQDFLRDRMQVSDLLEDWLFDELVAAATRDSSTPTLFVLAGNAGDGKSHLIFRLLRRRLAGRPEVLARIRAIADATHALNPGDSQIDRLADFFAPFADDASTIDTRIHLIAMNTGMVIRFFENPSGASYRQLYLELQRQLGLRRIEATSSPWRVEVVNLDLRDLLAPGPNNTPSFAERMLDRLDPKSDRAIPGPKWATCESCSAFGLCPVAFNLQALREEQPRRALLRILRRTALDVDVHLSPRNLWGFLYRLITGGTERYDVPGRGSDDGGCDIVRAQVDAGAGEWLLGGQFTELLFGQGDAAGAPWSSLARHDPAFSSAPEIDHLHTRLAVRTELDNAPEIVAEQLGGTGRVLAGLHLDALASLLPDTRKHPSFKGRRRDAAVRRQVLFHSATFDAWAASDGGSDFEQVLAAYGEYSHGRKDIRNLSLATREQVKLLGELVQKVCLHGNGRFVDGTAYLRVSQPNVRARSELLVKAERGALEDLFSVLKIVAPDIHTVAHADREVLLGLLGYRPTHVMLDVLGVRLAVDLELYDFLLRVNEGQKPSVRDLARFQALLFVGERVGNALAASRQTKELFLWDGAQSRLHRLATDAFGQPHLQALR
jgi:serine/threonine protein kinase